MQDPKWLGFDVDQSHGRWKQATTVSSTFTLTYPRSFNYPVLFLTWVLISSHQIWNKEDSLCVYYVVFTRVQFGGWHHDIRKHVPIVVGSGAELSSNLADSCYVAFVSNEQRTDKAHQVRSSALVLLPYGILLCYV